MDRLCQFQNIPTFLETTQLATREMLRTNLCSKLEPLASLGFLRKMLKLANAFHEFTPCEKIIEDRTKKMF